MKGRTWSVLGHISITQLRKSLTRKSWPNGFFMLHSAPLHTLIEGYSSSELAINKIEPFFQRFFFSQWIFKEKLKKSHVVHELRSIFLVIFTFNLGKRKLYITYCVRESLSVSDQIQKRISSLGSITVWRFSNSF